MCGACFLAGPEDEVLHLRVVLTPPLNGEVIVVSITTQRAKSETLVVVRPGDHPWIRHPSVVAYRYAEIQQVARIEAALAEGRAHLQPPMNPAVLDRIRAGLRDSDFTPNHVRQYLIESERA